MQTKIDIAVNVYGKTHQTLVTLKTLLVTNGEYIDKIYFNEEFKQPEIPVDYAFIKNELNYPNLIYHKPYRHLWLDAIDSEKARYDENYRHAIRYQYAFEKTDKKYLLTIHNDVLFKKSFINDMVNIADQGYAGVGFVGQCWNCPMNKENLCSHQTYNDFKLHYDSIMDIVLKYPDTRTFIFKDTINKEIPMPLPECRINEWCGLFNVITYNKEVIPNGGVKPLGSTDIDTGVAFFRGMSDKGHIFKNIDIEEFCKHAYFAENCSGHSSLFDIEKYKKEEELAKEYYYNNLKNN